MLKSDISQSANVSDYNRCFKLIMLCLFLTIVRRPYGKDVEHDEYWAAFQKIILSVGGRPHWAKDFHLSLDQMREIHPGLTRFVEIRNQLDPDRMFTNDCLIRILGE